MFIIPFRGGSMSVRYLPFVTLSLILLLLAAHLAVGSTRGRAEDEAAAARPAAFETWSCGRSGQITTPDGVMLCPSVGEFPSDHVTTAVSSG